MTQILGTLLDAGGSPITGKLLVSLPGNMVEVSTTPDTIYLPYSATFTITAGVVNITLQESETKKITYNFQFFRTDTEGELIEPALLNFNALVPNLSPVQFASLAPTGIVNDIIDTGAIRVANIIANTPALAQAIGGPFPLGQYNPTTTYKYRDLVSYLNRTYISKNLNPITGVAPTVADSWMYLPIETTGTLTLGDAAPYGSSWNGSGLAPSQNAVYDEIESVKGNIALKANLVSPIFSGDVTVPNQTLGDASTKVANTNFVAAGLADTITTINTALGLKANLVSPTFTGDPKAPTPAASGNDTSIATTAFVKNVIGGLRTDSLGTYYMRPEGSNLMIKFGTNVVTTVSEVGVVPYQGTPSFSGILTVICTNGDSNATTSPVMVQAFSANNFTVRSPGYSGSLRVNWIAIGTV